MFLKRFLLFLSVLVLKMRVSVAFSPVPVFGTTGQSHWKPDSVNECIVKVAISSDGSMNVLTSDRLYQLSLSRHLSLKNNIELLEKDRINCYQTKGKQSLDKVTMDTYQVDSEEYLFICRTQQVTKCDLYDAKLRHLESISLNEEVYGIFCSRRTISGGNETLICMEILSGNTSLNATQSFTHTFDEDANGTSSYISTTHPSALIFKQVFFDTLKPTDEIIASFTVGLLACVLHTSDGQSAYVLCLPTYPSSLSSPTILLTIKMSCGSGTYPLAGAVVDLSDPITNNGGMQLLHIQYQGNNTETGLYCGYNISKLSDISLDKVPSCKLKKGKCLSGSDVTGLQVFGPITLPVANDVIVTMQNGIRVLFTFENDNTFNKYRVENSTSISRVFSRFLGNTTGNKKLFIDRTTRSLLILHSNEIVRIPLHGCLHRYSVSECLQEVLSCPCAESRFPPDVIRFYPLHATLGKAINFTLLGTNIDSVRNVKVGNDTCLITRSPGKIECEVTLGEPIDPEVYNQHDTLHTVYPKLVPFDVSFRSGKTLRLFPWVSLYKNKIPTVDEIWPNTTIFSGGLNIYLNGSHFELLDKPFSFFLTYINGTDHQFSDVKGEDSKCSKISPTVIQCVTPNVSGVVIYQGHVRLQLVVMKNAPHHIGYLPLNQTLLLTEDPTVIPLGQEVITLHDYKPNIVIYGERLDSVPLNEMQIKISRTDCILLNRTSTQIECRATSPPRFSCSSIKRTIKIWFGKNLKISNIGKVLLNNTNCSKEQSTLNRERTSSPENVTSVSVTMDTATKFNIAPAMESSTVTTTAISITVLVIATVVIVICVVLSRRQCRYLKPKRRAYPLTVHFRSETSQSYSDLPTRHVHTRHRTQAEGDHESFLALLPTTDTCYSDWIRAIEEGSSLLIPGTHLQLDKVVGEGHFGCVHKGKFLTSSNQTITVAVKSLHRCSSEHREGVAIAFLKEAAIMDGLKHEHVMTLYGVCVDKGDLPKLVLSFMENGDMKSYIRDERNVPTVKDLVVLGLQVVKGMEYIASLKIVHRDLAARNCMLDADLCVKVADFGLSRDVYESAYYSADLSKHTSLPIKWMAPECIAAGTFSEKTDVWSYGVLLWELLTRGLIPYGFVDNWDLEKYLAVGRRLHQPPFCPNTVYTIMMNCWQTEPSNRPSFTEIRKQLEACLKKADHKLLNGKQMENIEKLYVNIDN